MQTNSKWSVQPSRLDNIIIIIRSSTHTSSPPRSVPWRKDVLKLKWIINLKVQTDAEINVAASVTGEI